MTIEVPVLHLGLAGYTEAQQKAAADAAAAAAGACARWVLGSFAEADAWWLEGSRTLLMANQHLRVQPAVPTGRSVQLALADVDRPVAFSAPVTAPGFQPAITFDLADKPGAVKVLQRFADLLQVMLSQFALASSLAQEQPMLNSGSWEVLRDKDLLAVVDLRLGAGVMPGATPADFEGASWCLRDHGAVVIPGNYARVSVSQLMWQYAQRTERDLLPPHYRSQKLYFRRPPRLPQRQLRDAHLLLMRELAEQPGLDFAELQQSTGLGDAQLARYLSALYAVGSITSNPKRATASAGRLPGSASSQPQSSDQSQFNYSMLNSTCPPEIRRQQTDKTAPAPLLPEFYPRTA
jgi:hypothetical protein